MSEVQRSMSELIAAQLRREAAARAVGKGAVRKARTYEDMLRDEALSRRGLLVWKARGSAKELSDLLRDNDKQPDKFIILKNEVETVELSPGFLGRRRTAVQNVRVPVWIVTDNERHVSRWSNHYERHEDEHVGYVGLGLTAEGDLVRYNAGISSREQRVADSFPATDDEVIPLLVAPDGDVSTSLACKNAMAQMGDNINAALVDLGARLLPYLEA